MFWSSGSWKSFRCLDETFGWKVRDLLSLLLDMEWVRERREISEIHFLSSFNKPNFLIVSLIM